MRRVLAAMGMFLVLGLGAAVRWTTADRVADLLPRPDALEYEEAARNLLAGEGYSLVFDGGRYPPRYPPGFSLLLVPAVWITSGVPGGGIWAVLGCALAGIAASGALGWLAGGPATGVAAAALVALGPLHARWSRAVMSDVPAATLTTLLVLAAVWCASHRVRDRAWVVLGVAVGLGALVRSTCALLPFPLGLAAIAAGGGRKTIFRHVAVFAAGVAAGLLPTALYNVARFGSPLRSGYEYWVAGDLFGWGYVLGSPAGGGESGNLGFYLRQLVGLGTLYAWPVAGLALVGVAVGMRRPGPGRLCVALTLGILLVLLSVHVPFFWQWDRFLLPALPLLAVVAALPVGAHAPRPVRLGAVALVALVLARAVLTPAELAPPNGPLGEVAALRTAAVLAEGDAVLIADAEPFLVARLFHDGTDRQWIPLGRSAHQRIVRTLRRQPYAAAAPSNWVHDALGPPENPAALLEVVEAMLATGRSVYLAAVREPKPASVERRWSQLDARFRLEPVPSDTATDLLRVLPAP